MTAKKPTPDIIYTKVDEAPELASASLLPVIQAFAGTAGITGHLACRAHHRGVSRAVEGCAAPVRRPRRAP
jgi:hypothetical protein